MVSKSFLSTISSRFADVLTLTIYLQIFCEFKTHFFGEGRFFRQEATVHGRQWGCRRWRGMSCSCAVVHCLCKAVSVFFFFLVILSRKYSISKTLMQQRCSNEEVMLALYCLFGVQGTSSSSQLDKYKH